MSFQPPNLFDTSFEDLALGLRNDFTGGTDGHGIVQSAITHTGSRAWRCYGLKNDVWAPDRLLECLGGPHNGQTLQLGDLVAEGLVAPDSQIGTTQFADGGNGYPKLLMMPKPDGWQGPDVPNDGLYHWTVSNGYPRARVEQRIGNNNVGAYDDMYMRVHFYLTRLDGYVQILRLYSVGVGEGYISMIHLSQGNVTVEGVGGEFSAPATISLNEWHYLEMFFRRSSTGQGIKRVWLDDPYNPIIDRTSLDTSIAMAAQSYTPLTGLVLCGTYPNCELDFVVDNFAGSNLGQIGPATASPQATLNLNSSPISVPVTLDGVEIGSTPQSPLIPLGDHTIEVPQEVDV